MSHTRTMTKGGPMGLLAHEAPGTMFRLGFTAIALACGLIAVTGDASARQETLAAESAYCTRLYGLFWKYHANYYHHDGTWAKAELARSDCQRGELEQGIKQLEDILRADLFTIPSERSSTYLGFARP